MSNWPDSKKKKKKKKKKLLKDWKKKNIYAEPVTVEKNLIKEKIKRKEEPENVVEKKKKMKKKKKENEVQYEPFLFSMTFELGLIHVFFVLFLLKLFYCKFCRSVWHEEERYISLGK